MMAEETYLRFWESRSNVSMRQEIRCRDIDLIIEPGVFNPDSEITLSSAMFLDLMDVQKEMRVLDLGSGSGVISVAAAKRGASIVVASDIDKRAVYCTTLNTRINEVEERVIAIKSDLFESFNYSRFDRIYANLPILDAMAADTYNRLLDQYSGYLSEDGELWLSYASFGDPEFLEDRLLRHSKFVGSQKKRDFGVEWMLLRFCK